MPIITSAGVVAAEDIMAAWGNAIRAEMLTARHVGGIMPWPTTSAPEDFLLCQGQTVSRTTYAALFGVISTTYGAGDGSTTFRIPDLTSKVTDTVSGVSLQFAIRYQ